MYLTKLSYSLENPQVVVVNDLQPGNKHYLYHTAGNEGAVSGCYPETVLPDSLLPAVGSLRGVFAQACEAVKIL